MFRLVLLLPGLALAFCGCKPEAGSNSAVRADAPEPTNSRTFQVKGVIRSLDPQKRQVEIQHEAIPGYMSAMTMQFDVRDTNELASLQPGQPVSFRLNVTDKDGWVDQLVSLGPPTNLPSATEALSRPIQVVQPLKPGESLPAYTLTNQFGQVIKTSQYQGQALAITFLFTRCPFPTFCPRLANDFSETQSKLLESGTTNWHLLTISFDPEFDTPPVLLNYAKAHQFNPEHWTFATGNIETVTALGDLFGLAFWRDSTGSITHNVRAAVFDASGRLQKVFEGNNWKSSELTEEMLKALQAR